MGILPEHRGVLFRPLCQKPSLVTRMDVDTGHRGGPVPCPLASVPERRLGGWRQSSCDFAPGKQVEGGVLGGRERLEARGV